MFDLIIIGGGPAGLSAAVNAAAEGLETCLIAERIGGQAGTSSRIENYAGFPEGISGPHLTDRICSQARKFGALLMDDRVTDVTVLHDEDSFAVHLASGTLLHSRQIVLACGVHYNRPDWAKPFERKGVHYAATPSLINSLAKNAVAVVGGGNSAGQAALYASSKIKQVYLLVRGSKLSETMSEYLYDRILKTSNIDIRYHADTTLLSSARGTPRLSTLTYANLGVSQPGVSNNVALPVDDVFVMIGAKPNCGFVDVELDDKGFITTNPQFESSCPGIFAVGDIRSGSIKRVANAAGEGAAVIQHVYAYAKDHHDV